MKSRWIKLCSILLVLTMLINMLPVHALALDSEDRGSASVQGDTESHTVQIIGEVEGLREEGIKHFRLSDGSFVAVSYGLPVHFQNSGGQWIDIDNRLSLAAGAYRTANANAPAAFSSTLANGKLFTVEHGGQSVSMSLLDTTMADQMISGELDTDPEETLPAEETEAITEPIVETTAETEPSIEETVPAEPATEPETTIQAEETDVITEESLPEELPESGETEAMSGEDPENTADFAEGETEPTVSTQPTPTEKTVETQPEATETEPAETGASETEETVPAPSATEETIPEETEPEETGPEDLDEATGLVFNRDVVAEVTTDTPAMLTLQDKYNWDVNDVIPQKLQSSLIYQDVFPGIDLQYTNFGYNIKEQIIINEPQESYRFDFLLESNSLTAVLNENSSVSFLNSDQEEIYRIPIPCMEDASGLGSFDVHFALNETEQGTVLTVEADKEWINSAERTYPVKIDPTLVVVSGRALEDIYSVYTMEAAPNDTTLGRQWLYVGAQPYSTSNDGRYRTYMHFQTMPTVPSGSEVVDAQLSLYKTAYTQRYCEKLPIGAYEVTTGLPSGYSSYYDWFSKMTWRRDQPEYDASNAIDYAFGKAGKEYVTWHLTELVKKWYIEGTSNTTIALAMTNEDAIQTTSYYASATFYAYAGSIPPILTVSYRNNTGIEPYYTYATLGTGEAGTAYISDHTGQLKIAKELVSYASSTNPFSLNLVYNSDYFARSSTDYCPPAKLGLSMNVGSGWTLDCIQRVESETISNISYLKYSDGDGTIHYFSKDSSKDSSYYYDEDGLSLKIKSTGTNAYLMSDDDGNEWTFTGNYLTSTKDSDGNKININYSSGRLSSITQENKGQSAITMATFTYSGNDLISVTDAAGNVYTLTYSGTNLVGIKRSSSTIASYTYSGYQATKMTDSESGYSLSFTYSNGKVSRYQEVNNSGTGATVSVTYPDHSETVYRDHGADRVSGNSDDVLTHYLFDYAGRTVNAYTTDNTGNILGATNAVYSGSGSTDKANNRTLRTGSIGVARQQLLSNPGLEDGTGGWTFNNGTSRATTKPRTGSYSIKGTLSSGSQYALVSSGTLTAGKPYTVSGYVNTSAVTKIEGGGVSITVTDGSQGWTSQWINYITSTAVDDGWVRISVTFTPPATDEYGIFVNNNGAIGTFYADDFQVEEGDAPSSYNLVTNSNMEGTDRWTMGTNAAFSSTYGVAGSSRSLKITGDPLSASTNAYQDITLNLPGTQTYVLSGWARANAVPDDPSELDNPNDVTKKCGLRATITYSDGTTEGHYVAFNSDISNQWQFTSISIVPKQPAKTVQKIRVTLAYEGNANDCYFDNIALLREVAQTMKYDTNGKLVSVTSTGLDKDENTYSGGNLIKTVTGGNGTFTYTYDTTYTHRLKSVSNGQITQAMGYDSTGNVTTTTLSGSGGKTIQTTAAYGGSGNRLTSVTDAAGATVSYSYGNSDSVMRSLPTSVTDPNGIVTTSAYDTSGRVTQTGIANTANLLYTYTNGNLSAIQRTNSSGASQTYNFTYDSFGNMLSVKVGSRNLAANIYANGNGQLTKQTYGNGATVNYTYDILGRIKTATYSDGRKLTYAYNGEGQLHSLTETGGGEVVTYVYTYDSIGRLLNRQQLNGENTVLRTSQSYNSSNQLTKQSWQVGSDSYAEDLTYNSSDGSLNTFSIARNGTALTTFTMGYDGLQRLTSMSSGIFTRSYAYRDISDSKTTTQVKSVDYSRTTYGSTYKFAGYAYTYDNAGNILTSTDNLNNVTTYTYDDQNQLLTESGTVTSFNGPPVSYNNTYTYDTTGNILTSSDGETTHTYTYGDAEWKDLLTAYDGESITYDAIGNPTSYYNGNRWTMGWENGRQLTTLSKQPPVVISTQPENYYGTVGGTASFTVAASGDRVTYQWQCSTDDGETWSNVNGSTSTTLNIPIQASVNGNLYRCIAKDYMGHVATSQAGRLTVTSSVATLSEFDPEFTLINEPDDYYGRPGDTATFIVEAEGANLSYQWLCRAPGASNFEYLTGETSSTLRVDMTSASNGAEYRCFITDANGDMGSTRIATVKLDTRDWQMEYNTSGIRTKRTSDDKTYSYIYAGDKLMRMTVGNDVLDFSYDVNGTPLTMTYNGTVYYYITNLQGDVMKLERADGGSGAQYAYDAWGNIIAIMGTLAELNPLRYRGYVYDQETGFYYLQSRYYDPAVGRFISADNFASTGQGIVGHNMFAYCNNNPAACVDGDGDIPQAVTDKLVHDAVLAMIAFEQPNLSMTQTCIYYNGENIWGGFGYCDLFNTVTGEVWELKKDSQSRSCRTSSALAQLTRYTTGKLKHHPDLQLKFPNATKINSGNFSFKAAGYIYDVSYWSENNGILRYRYTRTETNLRKTVEAIATIAVFAVMLATPYGILGAGASYMLI